MALLSKAPPPPPTKPSLAEKVDFLHQEIEALLDATVEKQRAECRGLVHPGVIRQTIVRGRCICALAGELEKMK
jgi:hypothetical protein